MILYHKHRYITTKQEETRNAIADIDQSIEEINHHHAVAALNNLRRTVFYYYYDQSANNDNNRFNNNNKKRQYILAHKHQNTTTAGVDPRDLDQLILDALEHAKKMRTIVAELNEALDEFEEQFNLPRFEPNFIDDNNNNDENF